MFFSYLQQLRSPVIHMCELVSGNMSHFFQFMEEYEGKLITYIPGHVADPIQVSPSRSRTSDQITQKAKDLINHGVKILDQSLSDSKKIILNSV